MTILENTIDLFLFRAVCLSVYAFVTMSYLRIYTIHIIYVSVYSKQWIMICRKIDGKSFSENVHIIARLHLLKTVQSVSIWMHVWNLRDIVRVFFRFDFSFCNFFQLKRPAIGNKFQFNAAIIQKFKCNSHMGIANYACHFMIFFFE